MSRGYNKAILMGNLAKDPDIRHTPSKQKVARFTVAVGRKWKDKYSGETKEQTDFISIVAWGFLAELAENYLRKGKPVLVEGRIQVRDYDDPKTGTRRWVTEVIAEGVTMLSDGNRERTNGRSHARENENLPGQYAQDMQEEDFPLDVSDLPGDVPEVEVPF